MNVATRYGRALVDLLDAIREPGINDHHNAFDLRFYAGKWSIILHGAASNDPLLHGCGIHEADSPEGSIRSCVLAVAGALRMAGTVAVDAAARAVTAVQEKP